MSIHVQELLDIIGSCPWLWWLGVTPTREELRELRRRASDRSVWLKTLTVFVVPGLTAIGAFVAAWYAIQLSVHDLIIEQQHINDHLTEIHKIVNRAEDMAIENRSVIKGLEAKIESNAAQDKNQDQDIRELRNGRK